MQKEKTSLHRKMHTSPELAKYSNLRGRSFGISSIKHSDKRASDEFEALYRDNFCSLYSRQFIDYTTNKNIRSIIKAAAGGEMTRTILHVDLNNFY